MQVELFRTHGGKRKGAGRKRKAFATSERHDKREVVTPRTPVHVTLRVGKGVPYLRNRATWRAVAKATIAAAKTGAIRVVHASVQHNHVHLLVEANDQYALAKGMHAFQISAAHWINGATKRKGQVFPDRYNAHVLKTPREAHHAIRYVLSNWRKHEHAPCGAVDPFSTGHAFWGARMPKDYEPLPVDAAKCWLLAEGWRKSGEISPYEVPG